MHGEPHLWFGLLDDRVLKVRQVTYQRSWAWGGGAAEWHGGQLRASGYELARFVDQAEAAVAAARRGSVWRGRRTLEVGAGVGLPSMVLAAHGANVTATDVVPALLRLLRRGLGSEHHVFRLDVRNATSLRAAQRALGGSFDAVIAGGIISWEGGAAKRRHFHALTRFLGPCGFLLAAEETWAMYTGVGSAAPPPPVELAGPHQFGDGLRIYQRFDVGTDNRGVHFAVFVLVRTEQTCFWAR